MDEQRNDVSAQEFDQMFAAAAASTALKEALRTGFPDLPDWVNAFSFVPASGLRALADDLDIGDGGTLLDIACGLGGPGLFVGARLGARMIGLDWSHVGTGTAAATAQARGINASYVVASGATLPIRDASIDAAISIDALPFLPALGLPEIRRVLRPGGRIAFTAWERDAASPPLSAIPRVRDGVENAGLVVRRETYHPEWLDMQRTAYLEAQRQRDAGNGDAALAGLAEEADMCLPVLTTDRRVAIVAERPE